MIENDPPIFTSCKVGQCRGQNGCDGRVHRAREGTIQVEDYSNTFNCLWEIKGIQSSKNAFYRIKKIPEKSAMRAQPKNLDSYANRYLRHWNDGSSHNLPKSLVDSFVELSKGAPGTRVQIKIDQSGENFGIENHRACGFDRLNIQSGAKNDQNQYDKFARICSNKLDSTKLHNALIAPNSVNRTKIENAEWQAGFVELNTNHVRIGFDTDNQGTGAGFKIDYKIVGLEEEATFEEVRNMR